MRRESEIGNERLKRVIQSVRSIQSQKDVFIYSNACESLNFRFQWDSFCEAWQFSSVLLAVSQRARISARTFRPGVDQGWPIVILRENTGGRRRRGDITMPERFPQIYRAFAVDSRDGGEKAGETAGTVRS